MRTSCLLPALLAAAVPALAAPPDPAALARTAEAFRRDVTVLAAPEMEGRGIGTAGLDRAADWVEARLRAIGLQPAFGASYRQPVRVKTGVRAVDAGNRLEGVAEGDWTPLGISASGAFDGELVFAGYGVEAPAIGYRELDGLDLRGRVVLMLRYEPQEKDDASPFAGRRPSRFSALRYKVRQARERGAAAVVFVTGPLQAEPDDHLPVLKNDGPESDVGLPVLQVKESVARRWLQPAGVDLAAFQKAVDGDLVPRPRQSTGVRVKGRVTVEATHAGASNLAGLLPGRGRLAGEVVVLGAHYDHLGLGGTGSMRPNENAVHPGADDNASGTVAVLLAAERLRHALERAEDRRTVLVALFAAEELGLAGSARFVADPPLDMKRVVAMVNLDMVGRLRDDQLAALGSDSAEEWEPALMQAAAPLGLKVTARGDGYGPSDQTSFYAAGVPVLHFFTGVHGDYHAPSDTAETLDAAGAARVVAITAEMMGALAEGRLNPKYRRAAPNVAMASGPAAGDARGYGAWLGTVPDFSTESKEPGVLLADVRPGGPAEAAGIRAKDRLVGLAGTTVRDLHDMTFALQDHKPGETVDVVVVRDGQTVTLRATLGERRAGGVAGPLAAASPAAPPAAAPALPPPAAHGAMPAAEKPKGVDPYYAGRPGPEFVPGAGKPFAPRFEGESHLADIRQLTFGGENAEAYFSPDGRQVIFQATVPGAGCDQQYVMNLATGDTRRVSNGAGRTTCGYFDYPEADRIVYASTHGTSAQCPAPPDRAQGYVWAIYDAYDIWEAAPDGSNPKRLTDSPGYDAEATWCHRGGSLVFTSIRDGDLDLYTMDEAGEVTRLTREPGYDGGAFYSPDCRKIVWRASRPQGPALDEYKALLAKRVITPIALEVYVMDADGTHVKALTANGRANFGPTFTADGRHVVYSSNAGASVREFDLWMVGAEGGEAQRVTTAPGFDGFPHFSPDGRYLVFASNRADPAGRETNLFLARWVD